MIIRNMLVLCLGVLAAPVFAQTIYTCTNPDGGKVYSTTRDFSNCKAVSKGPETVLPALPKSHSAVANPTPGNFPRVQEDTQKARDGDRRHILSQELSTEQRGLEQARKDLAEVEAQKGGPAERLTPYKERVGQHERNIQAIQKELGALK